MSCSNTKKASILLVRKLYTLMQYLGPLPDSVCLSMTLSYYDDGMTNVAHHLMSVLCWDLDVRVIYCSIDLIDCKLDTYSSFESWNFCLTQGPRFHIILASD